MSPADVATFFNKTDDEVLAALDALTPQQIHDRMLRASDPELVVARCLKAFATKIAALEAAAE